MSPDPMIVPASGKASGNRLDLNIQIENLPNPRKEAEDHYYNPVHTGLLDLGMKRNFLTDEIMDKMVETVMKFGDRIVNERIFRGVQWKK